MNDDSNGGKGMVMLRQMRWYLPLCMLWIMLFRLQQVVFFFPFAEVFLVVMALLFLSAAAMLLVHMLPGPWRSIAGILSLVVMVPAMLYTTFTSVVRRVGLANDVNWNARGFWTLMVLFGLIWLGCLLRPGLRRGLERYFTLVFSVLCLYQAVMLALAAPEMSRLKDLSDRTLDTRSPARSPMILDTSRAPDIYFLVFDAYGGNSSLRKYFGFSNLAVTDSLAALGFQVSGQARSAYHFTPYAVSSVLNLDHEYDWGGGTHGSYVGMSLLLKSIRNNRLTATLAANGYTIHNLGFFDFDQAERERSFKPFTAARGFGRFLLENSILLRFFVNPVDTHQGQANLDTYAKLLDVIAHDPRRKFVFAHFMLPHPAYYLDSAGHYYPDGKGKFGIQEKDYLEQVKLANQWMLKVARNVLSIRPGSILVFQGDHGSLIHFNGAAPAADESNNPFSAVYIPSGMQADFPDTLFTPNTFRKVLNMMSPEHKLPMIPDSMEYYRDPMIVTGTTSALR